MRYDLAYETVNHPEHGPSIKITDSDSNGWLNSPPCFIIPPDGTSIALSTTIGVAVGVSEAGRLALRAGFVEDHTLYVQYPPKLPTKQPHFTLHLLPSGSPPNTEFRRLTDVNPGGDTVRLEAVYRLYAGSESRVELEPDIDGAYTVAVGLSLEHATPYEHDADTNVPRGSARIVFQNMGPRTSEPGERWFDSLDNRVLFIGIVVIDATTPEKVQEWKFIPAAEGFKLWAGVRGAGGDPSDKLRNSLDALLGLLGGASGPVAAQA